MEPDRRPSSYKGGDRPTSLLGVRGPSRVGTIGREIFPWRYQVTSGRRSRWRHEPASATHSVAGDQRVHAGDARSREAVLSAIEDLGYVPNRAARLGHARTDCIALVVSVGGPGAFAEPFFAGVVRGVSAEIAGTALQSGSR